MVLGGAPSKEGAFFVPLKYGNFELKKCLIFRVFGAVYDGVKSSPQKVLRVEAPAVDPNIKEHNYAI